MSYVNHFKHADDMVAHLQKLMPTISDPLLRAKYVGFVAVVAVTVYELALKEIFIEFGRSKHKVLGHFTEKHFERINGRIKIKMLQDDYIERFGDKYLKRFKKYLDKKSKTYFMTYHRDIKNSYSNIITWRNDFAHEGNTNSTATFDEVVMAYEDGKEVIHCLASSMHR